MLCRRVLPSLFALAVVSAPLIASAQDASETYLPGLTIYGNEPATPATATPDTVRARGGVGFFDLGFAGSDQYGAAGGGVGLSFHVGVQVNNLIGIYAAVSGHSLLFVGDGEVDAFVDFTLRDRVQVGLGIGAVGVYSIYGYGAPAAVTFPFHIAVTPALWRQPDGHRHGFQIGIDIGPGFAADRYSSGFRVAGSMQLTAGWEWY